MLALLPLVTMTVFINSFFVLYKVCKLLSVPHREALNQMMHLALHRVPPLS